jgi:hypothetical protein
LAQRLHGHRRDELRGRLGHHHLHRGAFLDQGAAQLGGLVAGDAAGEAQNNVFVLLGHVHGDGNVADDVPMPRGPAPAL